jgi:hypothetical protein
MYVVYRHFQQYFSYIVAVNFIGGVKPQYPEKKHWPVASHGQILSHNVVYSTPRHERVRTHNVSGDNHWLHR